MTVDVLVPFSRAEATDPHLAAKAANVTPETIRRWAKRYGLGRRIGGRWYVSRPALAMWTAGDLDALALYHAGERSSPAVALYFDLMRCRDAR